MHFFPLLTHAKYVLSMTYFDMAAGLGARFQMDGQWWKDREMLRLKLSVI